jgi:endoglucanase
MRITTLSPLLAVAILAAGSLSSVRAESIRFAGVNLSGAEFGQNSLPGTYNTHYTYPTQPEVDYFRNKSMNIVRLPFRWERLQQSTNANFNAAESNRFHTFVSATTAKGVYVVLDPHNFARYYPDPGNFQSSTQGLIGTALPNAVFTNLWFRLANLYKTNGHVIFNLMNEPNTMPTEQWVSAANDAIASIRSTGATNLILVPGNAWTGAHSWSDNWYGTPNATAMLNIVDSGNNYAFDVHQYLDSDSSGSSSSIVNSNIGATRLAGFTQWLHTNNRRGFLGEFAVANSTIGGGIGDEAIINMLNHIAQNADVWLGWTWWSAGPWWGGYMFTLEPTNLGQPSQTDQPAMAVLRNFIPIPPPMLTVINDTQFRFTAQAGFVYQPQTAPDLINGPWANYGSSTTGSNQSVTITMATGSGDGGFYRVRATRAP